MRKAEPTFLSYGDKHVQTILFNHRDSDWLKHNANATKALLRRCTDAARRSTDVRSGQTLITGVPSADILSFVSDYWFHEESWNLRADALSDYIKAENAANALLKWRVLIVGQTDKRLGDIDLGLHKKFNLLRRSRLNTREVPYANIKSLISRQDALLDLDVKSSGNEDWTEIVELRNKLAPGEGLLLIYPIDRLSPPIPGETDRRSERVPLDAIDDVIGVAMVFPASRSGGSGRRYMTQDLSKLVKEQPDFVEQVEEDDEGVVA